MTRPARSAEVTPLPLPDRCYWHRDETGAEIMIPMCMGCAVSGPEQCTCDVPGSQIDQVREELRQAKEDVDWLHERLTWKKQENESLHRNNNALRKQLRDHILGRRP